MTIVALTNWQIAWWVTLGVLLVVAGVVWLLLELLRRTVRDVESRVSAIWAAGKGVAQNTQTTHLLQTTVARGSELAEEVEQHRAATRGGEGWSPR